MIGAPGNVILKARAMIFPLLKICFLHPMKMVLILIGYWAIYVKKEDPCVVLTTARKDLILFFLTLSQK